MKRLPKQKVYRIYNPIDNKTVDNSQSNPVMLQNGVDTYKYFQSCSSYYSVYSGAGKHYDWNIVDDGLEYNNFRLVSPSSDISYTDPGFDQYCSSDLYRLQNPAGSADWEENHSIYPCAARSFLIETMIKNYLIYPTYYVDTYSGLNDAQPIPSSYVPSASFFSTIPEEQWLYFAELAHKSFSASLAGDEGKESNSGKYDLDSYQKKLVVDNIRTNSGDNVSTVLVKEKDETVVYSETLEEFEREYQAFIEMLKAQKDQKS